MKSYEGKKEGFTIKYGIETSRNLKTKVMYYIDSECTPLIVLLRQCKHKEHSFGLYERLHLFFPFPSPVESTKLYFYETYKFKNENTFRVLT